MRLLQKRSTWVFTVYFSILLSSLTLLLCLPGVAWYSTRLNWIWLPLCIAVIFHPISRQPLSETPTHAMPFWAWLARVGLLQFVSQFILWGLIHSQIPISLPQLAHFTAQAWGLYPWPLCLMSAILLRHQYQPMSHALMPHYPIGSKPHLVVEFYFKQALLIGIAFSLALLIFQFSQQIATLFNVPLATGWRLRTFFIASLFFFVWLTLPKQRWLLETSLIRLLAFVSLCLCAALLVFNGMANSLAHYLALSSTATVPASIPVKAQQVWPYFIWGWWYGCLPIVTLYLVKISQGYSIRKISVGFLIITLLVWLAWQAPSLQYFLQPIPDILMPIVCFSILLGFLYKSGIDYKLLLSTALQTPAKQQLQQRTFSGSLIRSIILAVALLLVGGINLFAFIGFVWMLPCFVLLCLGVINQIKATASK